MLRAINARRGRYDLSDPVRRRLLSDVRCGGRSCVRAKPQEQELTSHARIATDPACRGSEQRLNGEQPKRPDRQTADGRGERLPGTPRSRQAVPLCSEFRRGVGLSRPSRLIPISIPSCRLRRYAYPAVSAVLRSIVVPTPSNLLGRGASEARQAFVRLRKPA